MHSCILFDLDGTLLDTSHDLVTALNQLLKKNQLPTIPFHIARPYAGHGCRGLLKIGMNIDHDHPSYPTLVHELLDFYEKHLFDATRLFSGMDIVLTHLEKNNIPWGIVTNKPKRFTDPLVKKLGLAQRTSCIISGDTLSTRKPNPETILHACNLLNAHPQHSIYIGDTETDVIASKAAGIKSLIALYGYIREDENPYDWQATGYIKNPEEIIPWTEKTA